MIRVATLLLAGALCALPLSVALTGATAVLAGIAGSLALAGLLSRIPSLLVAAAVVGLVEELVAVLQAGRHADLLSPVLLGIVIYVLLDVGAWAASFQQVAVHASIVRSKIAYWGWTSMVSAFSGLLMGFLAAGMAYSASAPLLPHLVAVLAAGLVLGAVVAIIRW